MKKILVFVVIAIVALLGLIMLFRSMYSEKQQEKAAEALAAEIQKKVDNNYIIKGGLKRYNPKRIRISKTPQIYNFDPNAEAEWWYDNSSTGQDFFIQLSLTGDTVRASEINASALTTGEMWVSKIPGNRDQEVMFTYSFSPLNSQKK